MYRGCIAIGDLICSSCQQRIEHAERYLVNENETGEKERLCLKCCLEKGYAHLQKEKGEEVTTFFAEQALTNGSIPEQEN
jgi:hypothetical protein